MKKIKKTFLIIFVLMLTGFISTAQNEKIPVTSSSEKAMKAKELTEVQMTSGDEIQFTAEEIHEKCIRYHDPTGVWDTYKGKMHHVTVLGQNYVVTETIEFDKPNDYYLSTAYQNFGTIKRGIIKIRNHDKKKLGRSGIEASPTGPGCWAIGGNIFMQGMLHGC